MENNSVPAATSRAANQPAHVHQQPEFIPLPAKGGDVMFGFSRSFWYNLERAGLLQLTRFRRPGCIRGRVMLPVPQARAALAAMSSGKHPSTFAGSAA